MIHAERIQKRIEEIYHCGEKKDGTHSRIAFSKEDEAGRKIFAQYLRTAGAEVHYDSAGNMIAHFKGSDETLPAIMMGSHLDTVPNGGKYDGVYGCVGPLEVLQAYQEKGIILRHPVDIIVFADEEGVRFGKGMVGSMAMSGQKLDDFLPEDRDKDGLFRQDVMKIYEVDFADLAKARRNAEDVQCFIELHVEQGRNLERRECQIGAVTTIAGVSRYLITVNGETNHSGSTMMEDRRDALVGVSEFIQQIPGMIKANGSKYAVGTVGKLKVEPGAMNVIPGKVEFTLEVREQTDPGKIELENILFSLLESICNEQGLTYSFQRLVSYKCAPMDQQIVGRITEICKRKSIKSMELPSGAFHDAMFMSRVYPTGMIFVPSIKGISHAPQEYTRLEDLAAGCEVLYDLILEMDKI